MASATAPGRALAKEAKRELQKLKQRGVQVQEIPPQGEPVLKPLPESEAPDSYASSIDACSASCWVSATVDTSRPVPRPVHTPPTPARRQTA